jgi:N-carbamoyl-L-amino-acid hydrolase
VTVSALLDELSDVGRAREGGYARLAWTTADAECRSWFTQAAESRDLAVETDRNGNLWAWWHPELAGTALVVGSHLDSVPNGGAFDGPLGIVSAFLAIDRLVASGFQPDRPLAVVAFADEEGARFGIACAGSRLLTGALDADVARALTDTDGVSMAEAMRAADHPAEFVGPDPDRLARIGEYIELHVEQGHLPTSAGTDGLSEDAPLGLATMIWPHGRWRLDLDGQQNHAGTTRLADRRDPMLDAARVLLAVRSAAEDAGVLATVGKFEVHPGAVNAIPGRVSLWIDARGENEDRVRRALATIAGVAGSNPYEESWTPTTVFDGTLAAELAVSLESSIGDRPPLLPSGAGHDAGVLALAGIPAAMILVRNPSGISHAPEEFADDGDCERGVVALAEAIRARSGAVR